jgi:hypothetical protein
MPTDGRESGPRQRDRQPGPVNTCWQKYGRFSSWLSKERTIKSSEPTVWLKWFRAGGSWEHTLHLSSFFVTLHRVRNLDYTRIFHRRLCHLAFFFWMAARSPHTSNGDWLALELLILFLVHWGGGFVSKERVVKVARIVLWLLLNFSHFSFLFLLPRIWKPYTVSLLFPFSLLVPLSAVCLFLRPMSLLPDDDCIN